MPTTYPAENDPAPDVGAVSADIVSRLNAIMAKLGRNGDTNPASVDRRVALLEAAGTRVEDEGATVVAAAKALNFAGAGVTVTDAGSGEATVTIPSDALALEDVYAANRVLDLTNANRAVTMNVASANTVTVPPNSTAAFPIGTVIEVFQLGAGATSIVAGSGVTIRSNGNRLNLSARYAVAGLRKRATDEWVLSGDLS
jgi:hypothetical protein